ncbi:MAG: sugar phosphate isomerase/epimerase [Clostridiaceae bacterium]|nr:sugar phosphate isomerase/epimerase [Clostridiaceae bacterium]
MNKTKIGISSFSYSYAVGFPGFTPRKPFNAFDLVDRAYELQVPVLQIADNYPLHKLSEDDLSSLNQYAQEKSVEIEVGTRGIETENILRYVEIAKKLNSKLLRVVIDTAWHQPDFDEIVHLLSQVLPVLSKENIILGIENHDRFKSNVFAEIVETLDSPSVGIVLDTVNSFACEENTYQVLDALAKHTVNFHVKDFKIERVKNNMGLIVTGTVAGEGFLNIPEVERRLQNEARCDYSSVLELWMAPEANMEDTLRKEDLWVKASISYLKKILDAPGSK